MKNRIKLILISAMAAIGLSNCVDVHQIVNVKKDGSGTIEEIMFIKMPPELAALGGGGENDPIADLLKGGKQEGRAKGMGEGVEFVSAEPFEGKDGAKGLKTIFKFADVSKLKLNGDAGMSGLNPDPNAKDESDPEKLYSFGFEKGDTSKLTIKTPPMDGIEGADADIDPQQFAMASQFMKGMRVRVTVKPDGKITKTNATYSDASSVTLADFEMDKLLSDLDKFKEFSSLGDEKDRKKVAAKLKELGIKGEAQEEVSIEFE